MNLLEVILGQIPEAVYFAIFMLLVKELKSKRIIFIIGMIIEYILLFNALPYSVWSHVLYFIVSYILMKVLYKNKVQIIDVFTLGIGSVILILISAVISLLFRHSIITVLILNRLLMFGFLFLFRNKLSKIQKLYKLLWNRNDKPKKMKTTTFRAVNTVLFNLLFYIINFGMLYALLFVK